MPRHKLIAVTASTTTTRQNDRIERRRLSLRDAHRSASRNPPREIGIQVSLASGEHIVLSSIAVAATRRSTRTVCGSVAGTSRATEHPALEALRNLGIGQ